MRISKKFGSIVLAGAMTAAGVLGQTTVAQAAKGDCISAYSVCLWANKDYTGGMKGLISTTTSSPETFYLTDFNDMMSSWYNRSSRDARWFKDGSGGTSYCMNSTAFLSSLGWQENDTASRVIIYTDNMAC